MNQKKIDNFFRLARNASLNSNFRQHHLGAVAIYRGNVLAIGYNSKKTSPIQKKYNKARIKFDVEASYATNSLHAEIACLTKIKYLDIDFSKVYLFIYREHKNGQKALAKPCPACTKYIKDMGIKDVYYTTESGWEHSHWE